MNSRATQQCNMPPYIYEAHWLQGPTVHSSYGVLQLVQCYFTDVVKYNLCFITAPIPKEWLLKADTNFGLNRASSLFFRPSSNLCRSL